MSKVLLICNAPETGTWLKKLAKQADFILAVDGGANYALAVGIQPDAVIGDLDSVSPRTRRLLKDVPFIQIKRQDNTDLEKALDWIMMQQFDTCIITGATGGRLDFTIGNILSAVPYLKHMDISFRGKNWILQPLTTGKKLTARKGVRCSFIPLTTCRDITLKGFKYSVQHETWTGEQIGHSLSNEISSQNAEIIFNKGTLLMYLEN